MKKILTILALASATLATSGCASYNGFMANYHSSFSPVSGPQFAEGGRGSGNGGDGGTGGGGYGSSASGGYAGPAASGAAGGMGHGRGNGGK